MVQSNAAYMALDRGSEPRAHVPYARYIAFLPYIALICADFCISTYMVALSTHLPLSEIWALTMKSGGS